MAVSAASTLMTEKKTEEKEELERILYVQYSVSFKNQTKTLLNSGNKVNVISQAFASQLGLKIWKTNVRAQRIDSTTLETYGIVVSTFSVLDKDDRERFFEENFLFANVKLDIVLGMSFLTINNADIDV